MASHCRPVWEPSRHQSEQFCSDFMFDTWKQTAIGAICPDAVADRLCQRYGHCTEAHSTVDARGRD